MKRIIVSTLLSGAVLASTFSGAFAASDNQSTPGTPGTANCQGQTIAYLAQYGAPYGFPGLGNLAVGTGLTVQQLHDLADAYCAQ